MSKDRSLRIEELFHRASEVDPARLGEFLERQCEDEPDLRAEVESLLRHERSAPAGFLAGGDASRDPGSLAPGSAVARYRVVRLLGRGGMGDVYEAQQDAPRRRVALKLLRPDRQSPQSRARFQVEAEALGQLHHPGIAQVFEAGEAAIDGRGVQSFIAMELVEGPTLLEFAGRRHLSVRARLELAARVCDAVAHAHQHGVIHRDLKPGNVLVSDPSGGTAEPAGAEPKVLDFGVARFVDAIDHAHVDTRDGQVLGTLAYMAPEQMEGVPGMLDTRADVYALGVVLYELLAGRLPHEIESRSLPDAILALRHGTPAPLGSVRAELKGDVETIVSRAMEKSPARRYASAAELAAELRRHLRGEPIEARAASRLYVLGRHLRLHWRFTGAAAAIVLLSAAFAVVAALQADRNRSLAAAERVSGERAREEGRLAELARLEAEQVSAVLLRLFESAHTHRGAGSELLVRELLDEFTAELAEPLAGQPAVLAKLLSTLGQANRSLGRTVEAVRLLRRSLDVSRQLHGSRHHAVARAQVDLGTALLGMRAFDKAEVELVQGLDLHATLGEACRGCVARGCATLGRLYRQRGRPDAARAVLLEARDAAECPPQADRVLRAEVLTALAELESDQADPAAAESLLREALALLLKPPEEDDAELHEVLSRLSSIRRLRGDLAEAEHFSRASIAAMLPSHGGEHPGLARHLNALALILLERGDAEQAHAVLLQALDLLRDAGPPAREMVITIRGNLALALRARGDVDAALALREEVLSERREVCGERSREVAMDLANLGVLLHARARYLEAEARLRESLEIHRALGGEHLEMANVLLNLGLQLEKLARFEEALAVFEESLELHRKFLGEEHLRTFRSTRKVAETLLELGRRAEAEPHFARAILLAVIPGIGRPDDEAAMTTRLARCVFESGRYEEAVLLEGRALELWRTARGGEHSDVAQALCNHGRALCRANRHAEAEALLRESVAMFERTLPGSPRRLAPLSWLGSALVAASDVDAGEALLVEAGMGLSEATSVAETYRRSAFELLAEHYERTSRADLAEPWRARAGK